MTSRLGTGKPLTFFYSAKYRNFEKNIPEKAYRGLDFYIHASVSDLYIPTIGLPILLEEICRPILGDYINRSQTHECGNWG